MVGRLDVAKAPCILLHGFAQTPASWDEVVRWLQAQGHRTYALDLYERKGDLKLSGAEWALEDGEDGAGTVAAADAMGAADVAGTAGAGGIGGAVGAADATGAADVVGAAGAARAGRDSLTSLEAVCDRVAAIVRLIAQVDGAPVLVGYSMGGRIAAETVVRHPDLPLAGLVLESAGLGPADEAARAALAERNVAWTRRLREEGVAAFMDWWETLPLFATQRELPPEVRAAIRAERVSRGAEPLARSLETWGAHHQAAEAATFGALADLAKQGVPVLYVAGALDEKYAAAAARVHVAGVPAVLVPNVGHNVHLESPSAFAKVVEGVLAGGVLA